VPDDLPSDQGEQTTSGQVTMEFEVDCATGNAHQTTLATLTIIDAAT